MRRVLIVDDDEMVRMVTGKILTRGGFEVASASGGDEALEEIEKDQLDLVLSDLRMPRMDGWELHRKMRLRGYDVPFLEMSGQADGDLKVFDGFVEKPFNIGDLLDNVERVMDRQAIA